MAWPLKIATAKPRDRPVPETIQRLRNKDLAKQRKREFLEAAVLQLIGTGNVRLYGSGSTVDVAEQLWAQIQAKLNNEEKSK
jgi:hypothetical protein